MSLTLTGTLKQKSETKQVSDNFSKIDFVVTDENTQYPQHVSFQAGNQKTQLLDNVNVGDKITVHFNLQGREWTSPQGEVKYFNTLSVWKLEKLASAEPQQETDFEKYTNKGATSEKNVDTTVAPDDLPF